MSEKSCPKSVLGLTNMPKKYQIGKPTRNIYLCLGLIKTYTPNGA